MRSSAHATSLVAALIKDHETDPTVYLEAMGIEPLVLHQTMSISVETGNPAPPSCTIYSPFSESILVILIHLDKPYNQFIDQSLDACLYLQSP